ncbi:MAG: NAD-dependent epimerase/dehydratase family protein [Chloroflexi bacterium]|nr:NAD-dependent epimerase/dehydratase family protein [Chloroflexota bacterium]
MTRALVTGGSGFIGAHVVRALIKEGVEVRALVRGDGMPANLQGLAVERAKGDLTDVGSLERALASIDVLFHVAALYELAGDGVQIRAVNVEGTRALMQAALRSGVERVVHTSSVAAIGYAANARAPATEEQWANEHELAGPYEASKYHSERLVHALIAEEGLPAVVVNPTAPIGALDVKPTPTGRLIRDAANGDLPGYLRGAGLNIVPVRDVAAGHVLAWQRGRVGERYILGHAQGNLTLREVMARAAALTGRRAPRLPLPWPLAMAYAQVDERWSRRRARVPRASIAGVRLARHRMWFNPAKAITELGVPQSSLSQAFADAVSYFRADGRIRA